MLRLEKSSFSQWFVDIRNSYACNNNNSVNNFILSHFCQIKFLSIDRQNITDLLIELQNCLGDEFSEEELLAHLRKPPSQTVIRVNMMITDQNRLKADLIPLLLTVLYAV